MASKYTDQAEIEMETTSGPPVAAPEAPSSDNIGPLRHSRETVILHWLTAACVVGTAVLALARDEVAGRLLRQWLLESHRHVGLLILLLAFVRLAMRFRTRQVPSILHSQFVRTAAWLTHAVLYATLIALPLIGWALSNAEAKPVHLFGLVLPALVAEDEDLADRLLVWHQDVAWLLLTMVTLHVAAALWHHFVRQDGVLQAMLPTRRR